MPSELIEVLRRCVSLQHLLYQLPAGADGWPERADLLMEVQRAVPRVHWHMSGAPSICFDETQK